MTEQFEDQGGAASSNPPALVRWISSRVLSRLVSSASIEKRRDKAERARRKAGKPHRIEYFHQVDDPYSHMAAQLLRRLLDQYDVELVCHLVSVARDRNLPEPDLLPPLSRSDCAAVAPHYGVRFPEQAGAPDPGHALLAARILAASAQESFPEIAAAVGDALWAGDGAELASLEKRHGSSDPAAAEAAIAEGTARRTALGHYSGGMLHYGDEWYWGADRLHHLEGRLVAYGARREGKSELVCPRPAIEKGPLRDDGSLTLEFFPSLRSPYTSLIFDETVQLAEQTGVELVMRPVLPMVMRGVSLTRQKGLYIFHDAAREAASLGLDWGHFYDPIGDPVRNCYSLYPWAREQGRGTELLSSFLRAAFFEGVSTNSARGMQRVVERAELSWSEAKSVMGNSDWEAELEANRLAMYEFDSWGVPSYRLLDRSGATVRALWGQDRLWLFSREIQRLLGERAG
jgi:2-hydroxychromene-2-carboxylate isomerase